MISLLIFLKKRVYSFYETTNTKIWGTKFKFQNSQAYLHLISTLDYMAFCYTNTMIVYK